MRSLGKGVCQPQCESVKVLSPEIYPCCIGPRVSFPGSQYRYARNGESITGVSGSESVAGKRTVCIGTWENRIAPNGSCQGAEKATKRYGVSVVGLTHSRGVGGVMPVESRCTRHSKGSALIRKDEIGHSPDTELGITIEPLRRLISEIATRYFMSHVAIEVSVNEEPVAGNPHGGFCEGHAPPYTEFIKTQSLLN